MNGASGWLDDVDELASQAQYFDDGEPVELSIKWL